MTIIPASALDRADMTYLGANVRAAVRRDRIERAAQQRSLAACGVPAEELTWLGRPGSKPRAGCTGSKAGASAS